MAFKETLLNLAEQLGGLRLLQWSAQEADNSVYVLAYHRVDDPNSPRSRKLHDLVSATPAQFDAQMRLLATAYQPVSAEQVLNAALGGKPLPPQAVLVTVDDGYRDFKDTIFPIAQKYGIRPVLFVPTAYIGQGEFWWDRLFRTIHTTSAQEIDSPVGRLSLLTPTARAQAFDALADHVRQAPFRQAYNEISALCDELLPDRSPREPNTLHWDELRALAQAGATIANHTHTHPILSHIPLDQARQEIRVAQELLSREIGPALPIFAYPDGRAHAIAESLQQPLKETGIQLAFTMRNSWARISRDQPLSLPRIVAARHLSPARFHLQLTPIYHSRKKPAGITS